MTQANPKFNLRPFQARVFEAVMQGKSVILQAPTGAGKTRAALAPFLQNLANNGEQLPLTCRYSVPLRVLASQFFKEYEFYGQKIDTQANARLCQTYRKFEQKPVQIQTGEQPDDPQFESALTFCTIDQLLASALGIPYGIGRRRANLNVGGILSSYLVFDEFHLFPLERCSIFGARTTALELLKLTQLHSGNNLTPFIMMTATFSTPLLKRLAGILGATVECIKTGDEDKDNKELQTLNAERSRIFHMHDTAMTARQVLDNHEDSSLVICNTVRRSQQMYLDFLHLARQQQRSTRVLLLHSRFTDDDRRWLQAELEKEVGKDAWKQKQQRDIIIVATQVIEVGLDISVTHLHSEIAPANSIIQRAGRCARFDKQSGHVHLYRLPPDSSYAPYSKALCNSTFSAFTHFDNQHVGFDEEQKVINAVHSDEDEQLLDLYEQTRGQIRSSIFKSLNTNDRGAASELIRNVMQISVLIHNDPKHTITERPWQWQSFSMHPGLLAGSWPRLAEKWAEHGEDRPFCFKPIPIEESGNEGERTRVRYEWESVAVPESMFRKDAEQQKKAMGSIEKKLRELLMIALPPALATYDAPLRDGKTLTTGTPRSGLGFILNDGYLQYPWPDEPYSSQLRAEYADGIARGKRFDGYEQESYTEHVRGLYNAYHGSRLYSELLYPARVFQEVLKLPDGAIDQAVRLAIACHDIGKLNHDWQHWCELWQNMLVEAYSDQSFRFMIRPDKQPFAHTDNNGSRQHFELEKKLRDRYKISRPHHACESAALACFFIEQVLQATYSPDDGATKLARATVAAIARHHAPQSQEYSKMRLCDGALEAIAQGLNIVTQGQNWSYDLAALDQHILRDGKVRDTQMTVPSEYIALETILYYLLVRVLRLADGRSFNYK